MASHWFLAHHTQRPSTPHYLIMYIIQPPGVINNPPLIMINPPLNKGEDNNHHNCHQNPSEFLALFDDDVNNPWNSYYSLGEGWVY